MDEAGFDAAHPVGNSLGAYGALKLAERGRARSVVALRPGGERAKGDDSYKALRAYQAELLEQTKSAAPHAEARLATPQGRRRATHSLTVNFEHIPVNLLAYQLRAAAAACTAGPALIENALHTGRSLDAERIICPCGSSGAPRTGCSSGATAVFGPTYEEHATRGQCLLDSR